MDKLGIIKGFRYSPSEVIIHDLGRKDISDEELKEKIDLFWDEAVKKAHQQNKKVWNSEIYVLESFKNTEGKIELNLESEEYKTWFYFYKHTNQRINPGLGVFALIETSDKKLILAWADTAFADDDFTLIGGGCIKSEMEVETGDNFFNVLYKEMKEEINLDKGDIDEIYFSGFVSQPNNVLAIFNVNLKISSEEVLKKYSEQNDGEIRALKFYTVEEIRDQFKSSQSPRYKLLIEWLT